MIGCVGIFFFFVLFVQRFFFLFLGGNGQRGWTKIFFIRYHGLICKLFCGGGPRINILRRLWNLCVCVCVCVCRRGHGHHPSPQVGPSLCIYNIFILNVYFDKFTIKLHFLFTYSMLAKFSKDQRSIIMSSIKYLNFKFLWSKIMHKN